MEIYQALKKDHDKVTQLLNELLTVSNRNDPHADELIEQIRDELIPHARAEESVFYNSLRTIDRYKDIAMHGYKEHLEAETLLRTLQAKGKTDMDWKATAKKLKEALEHHIQEEEGQMFEAARNSFSAEEARMMGEAFEKMKPEIREEGIIGTTWDMLANMMPPRFSKSFKDNKNINP